MNSKFDSYFRLLTLFIPILFFSACGHRVGWDARSSGDARPFDSSRGQTGYASWYGDQFDGRKTASGEIYDMYAMTAAHRQAPFGTVVRVTNLDNGKQTIVTINDRGPFVRGRIIDLSKKAATDIGMMGSGTAKVQLEFMDRKTPVPAPQAAKPSVSSNTTAGNIYIQLASFEARENASVYLSDFQRSMPNVTARIYKENNYYRVRSGPYSSEEAAQNDLSLLKKSNFDGFILHSN